MTKTKRITAAIAMLLVSATLLATASYAWFAMNTQTSADGFEVEAYTDSLYLEIKNDETGSDWGMATTVTENNVADLRLITPSLFKNNTIVTFDTPTAASGNYEGENTVYYKKVLSDSSTQGNSVYNYIKATDLVATSETAGLYKKPTFTLKVQHGEPDAQTTYYSFDTTTHEYSVVAAPTDVYGLYTMDTAAEAADALYDGSSKYYKLENDKLVAVIDLTLGTDLSDGYCTIANETAAPTKSSGSETFYLKNTTNGDYSYIGSIPANTVVSEYLFWGRAYSTDAAAVQENNTLNIIGDGRNTYYLTKTLYLQCAEGTNNASNLMVDDIVVGGATNVLTSTLRVLIVATSSADAESPKRISACLYDAGEDTYTYSNGTNLFDTVLGNEQEQITVDVYIYFDGTDADAKNSIVAGELLNGQTIEIKFGINELSYNPQIEPSVE
ncbi:MAG: hypothetical protein E7612_00185 [Ruminococcaceae bacterium]|nr:hypothetical protein [Oscillospiraceae bacterium]